jgi:hypothetical protein
MAVIDLNDGKKIKDAPDISQNLQGPLQTTPKDLTQGRIIDLDTGKFVQPKSAQQIEQPEQLPEGNFIDAITEPFQAIATSAIATPVIGLSGIASSIANQDASKGGEFVTKALESVQEVSAPRTQAGQDSLQTLGDLIKSGVDLVNFPISGLAGLAELITGQGLDKAVSTIKGVQDDGLGKTLGRRTFEETASPAAAALVQTLPDAALEIAGFKGLRSAKASAPEQISKAVQSEAERKSALIASDAATQTGVDLFPAQQTLNPTDIERQSFIAQLPEGAVKARESLGFQNQQALEAVDSVLNQLAPAESVGGAASKFRSASQKAIENEKLLRREKASPLYNQAFDNGADVNLAPINDLIESKLSDLPETGEISKSIKRAQQLIKPKMAKGEAVPPTLKRLHNAKIEIDQMINKVGDGSVGNTTKRELVGIQKELIKEINKASPLYESASAEFSNLSGPVNAIVDSPIGKIANLNDTQLKQVAKQIFDPSETNPDVIRRAKQTIEAADPEAWNIILRAELERRMGSIRADLGDTTNISAVENVPSQLFNSLFGNKKSRDVLFNSVTGDTKKNLKYLETALRRASKGRPGGSQTGIRAEISRELKGGIFQSLREFIKAPIDTVAGVGEEAAFNTRVRALSEVLFDPTWKDDMKELRSLPPASTKAKRILDRVLSSALITAPTQQQEEK